MGSSIYYTNRIMSIINQVSILGVGQAKRHLERNQAFTMPRIVHNRSRPHFTRREKENKESRRLYRPLIKGN